MVLLALDTAMAACSAAVWRDGAVLARRFEIRASGHAEALMPMLGQVLAEAGLTYADLDRLACTIGPGSFTGVRTGLAAARGLALALDRPLTGVTTLVALAEAARDQGVRGRLAVLHDARRDELYAQMFDLGDGLSTIKPAVLLPLPQLADWLDAAPPMLCGSGAALAPAAPGRQILDGFHLPDARHVAALAARMPAADGLPGALYLRAPDAKLPAA